MNTRRGAPWLGGVGQCAALASGLRLNDNRRLSQSLYSIALKLHTYTQLNDVRQVPVDRHVSFHVLCRAIPVMKIFRLLLSVMFPAVGPSNTRRVRMADTDFGCTFRDLYTVVPIGTLGEPIVAWDIQTPTHHVCVNAGVDSGIVHRRGTDGGFPANKNVTSTVSIL